MTCVIVGAGPAGLAAAIRLKQLAAEAGREISVCVIEKGSEVGAHILSGAVFEPRALNELFPDWRERGAPLDTPATEDRFLFLTERRAFRLPTPPQMHNQRQLHRQPRQSLPLARQAGRGAWGRDLSRLCRRRGALYDDGGRSRRRHRRAWGSARMAKPTANYPARRRAARQQTLFAEGCRGSLTKLLFARFGLRDDSEPQTYGLGVKELWEVDPAQHHPGLVVHTVGWPLDWRHLWRLVPLSPGESPGRGRLRGRARLQESVPVAVRGIAALQDASRDPPDLRRRAAHLPMARAP